MRREISPAGSRDMLKSRLFDKIYDRAAFDLQQKMSGLAEATISNFFVPDNRIKETNHNLGWRCFEIQSTVGERVLEGQFNFMAKVSRAKSTLMSVYLALRLSSGVSSNSIAWDTD